MNIKEGQTNRKHVLIVGLPRSGTSILASLVGAHSQISMCNEDFEDAWLKTIGKPIVGNKLCVPRQIDWDRRRTNWIKLLNRIGLHKLWPKSRFCLQDYLELPNLHIIGIRRDDESVRDSLRRRDAVTWQGMGSDVKQESVSDRVINYTMERGTELLNRLEQKENSFFVDFNRLIKHTESELSEICSFLDVDFQPQMLDQGPRWNWVYPEVSKSGIDASKAAGS